jgi:putative DNA primase/helicase
MYIDARHLAHVLGGKVVGRNQVAAPGPNHSRKDRSLVIKIDNEAPGGFLVTSFSGGDWRDAKDYVRERLGLPAWQPGGNGQDHHVPTPRRVDIDEGSRWTADEIKRINLARAIWRDGVNPAGTLAEVYLRRHRKIDLDDSVAGKVLRFNPGIPWHDEDIGETITVPALIAPFRAIDNNQITGVQRVRLNADGCKHSRRMLGVVQNAVIKIGMPDGNLAVAEGVETAMAAMQLGFKPAWALGSCGSISRFPVIDGIKELTLLGENDTASADAIKTCSERWLRAGRAVRVALPDDGYNDMADELAAKVGAP